MMPIQIEYLPDEPILIATYVERIDVPAINELYARSAEFVQQWQRRIYRIVDVREATSSFGEMMEAVKASSQGTPGSTTDPNVQVIFVGHNNWIQMFRSAMALRQFGQQELPLFLEMQDALQYARKRITEESGSSV